MGAAAMRVARPAQKFFGRAAAAAIVCGGMFAPRPSHADEPVPPEADTNPDVKPRSSAQANLILIGAAVSVGWYGIAVGTSYLWPDSDGAGSLRVPVAGPFMALAKTGCGSGEPDCDKVGLVLRTVVTVLSSVGQAGGLLAIGEGLFLPTASGRRAAAPRPGFKPLVRPNVSVTPVVVGRSGIGLSLSGSF